MGERDVKGHCSSLASGGGLALSQFAARPKSGRRESPYAMDAKLVPAEGLGAQRTGK
jgi:hypothetical protein